MPKGFTLIELMIVVAIIAILAAIAIPRMQAGRRSACETNAIAALKAYASAQAIYRNANHSAASTHCVASAGKEKWYADRYVALGTDTGLDGIVLGLIPDAFVNAEASTWQAQGAYEGYFFTDDATIAPADWSSGYGLYADPASYGKTGTNSYWIGTDGAVRMQDAQGAGAGQNTAAWAQG